MTEREVIEQAIAAQESLRDVLGEELVAAAITALRQKLAQLGPREVQNQRKQVTVLVGDLSGFTQLAEKLDAEELATLINSVWSVLDEIIVAHGGVIDKHIGDAVVALWGSRIAREDDPEQAVRAGLAMQTALAAGRWGGDEAVLQMRIGISTGTVFLGQVGTRREFTAVGEAVTLAEMLEKRAPLGGVLMTERTQRHVTELFAVEMVDTVAYRERQWDVYRVVRALPHRFRAATRGVAGVEAGFVGRDEIWQRLRQVWEEVIATRALRVTTILGEAGVGKSRLIYQLLDWLQTREERYFLLKGRARQTEQKVPFALARHLFSSLFQIQDNDRGVDVQLKMEQGVALFLGEDSEEQAHVIAYLLGFDLGVSAHIEGIRDDTRQIYTRGSYYIQQFFVAATAVTPVILLLEDLHWADEESLRLLQGVWRGSERCPVWVVAGARPALDEHYPAWGEGIVGEERIVIEPLTDEASAQLVRQLLHKVVDLPDKLVSLVVEQAEGNPFYLEEILKVLIADGVVVVDDVAWRVDLDILTRVRVPTTLTGVLQARIDRLDWGERRLLHQAAVVGRVFWDTAVVALAGEDSDAEILQEYLERLQVKGFIWRRAQSAFTGSEEYLFQHAVLHEVAYRQVLKSARRDYHERAAVWLMTASGEQLSPYAGVIADHWWLAEKKEEASYWYVRAGQQAQSAYGHETALAYYKRALAGWEEADLLEGDLAERGIGADVVAMYEGLGDIWRLQNERAEAEAAYQKMLQYAQMIDDRGAQVRAWMGVSRFRAQGEPRLAALAEAERIAMGMGEEKGVLAAVLRLKGWTLFQLGEVDEALPLAERALKLSAEAGDDGLIAYCLNMIGAVYQLRGKFELAEAYMERALLMRRSLGNRVGESHILNNLGETVRTMGDFEGALAYYKQALAIMRGIGDKNSERYVRTSLAGAQVALGEYEAALSNLAWVLEAGIRHTTILTVIYRYQAEAYLGVGQYEEALVSGREALATALVTETPHLVGQAWRVLGMVASELGEIVVDDEHWGAIDCWERGEVILGEGFEQDLAELWWCWGDWLVGCGEVAEGERRRSAARAIYERLGLTRWVGRMEGGKR
ncbi:MAG TPA: tetratricopeptide repeat protein [Anaerolineae bacterium]|nr:tetratricopeptide repeat protein [Anaerolineae bacterium]